MADNITLTDKRNKINVVRETQTMAEVREIQTMAEYAKKEHISLILL
ncbi:MAG TPA: hypothetical protein VMU83_03035 [Hanamia sp.]|nr:hypothetical protein [Hanamia sp.]